MKIAEKWVVEINNENKTPKEVIEEATHNPITASQIRRIQVDAFASGVVYAKITEGLKK